MRIQVLGRQVMKYHTDFFIYSFCYKRYHYQNCDMMERGSEGIR